MKLLYGIKSMWLVHLIKKNIKFYANKILTTVTVHITRIILTVVSNTVSMLCYADLNKRKQNIFNDLISIIPKMIVFDV